MHICIIAAMSENRVIGRAGGLPWHLSADLKRTRQLTTGHALVMGRKTFESIGRPLPDRQSIVMTQQTSYRPPGVAVAHSFEQAMDLAADVEQLFVFGGHSIYRLALPRADRMYLTIVHVVLQGDVFFPHFDLSDWRLREGVRHESDAANPYPYSFQNYDRIG